MFQAQQLGTIFLNFKLVYKQNKYDIKNKFTLHTLIGKKKMYSVIVKLIRIDKQLTEIKLSFCKMLVRL